MMRKTLIFSYLFFISSFVIFAQSGSQIIADHTIVDQFDKIPQTYLNAIKAMWLVVPGESHSAAYRSGLASLESVNSSYAVNVTESGTPEAYTTSHLRVSRATWGDINNESGWVYNYGEEDWCCYSNYELNPTAVSRTKAGIAYCDANNLTISAMGFGWCYDDGLWESYLTATQAYMDYCSNNGYDTKVFFTTGPVDDYLATGENGYNNYLRWEHIRDYVDEDATRILFDYADILSYNNDDELATETWNGHTYPVIHPDNEEGTYTGHIGSVGAIRLAKAMWWMLARMAGWDGGSTTTDITDLTEPDQNVVYLTDSGIIINVADQFINGQINLYNSDGHLMASQNAKKKEIEINMSEYPSSLYIIELLNNNIRETKKVAYTR